MELFEEIRRGYAAGDTILGLAQEHKVHRRMVRQALASAIAPERKRQERISPKVGPVRAIIDGMLNADRQAPRKQHHTARRIWRRLCQEQPHHSIAESTVLACINNRVITEKDFVRAGQAVSLSAPGRKRFFQMYEQRMSSIITHPRFDYKVSYRRALELQGRLLAKALTGEIADYLPLQTR